MAGVATGPPFGDTAEEDLLDALQRTVALVSRPTVWRRMHRAGLQAGVGWRPSTAEYAQRSRPMSPPQEPIP